MRIWDVGFRALEEFKKSLVERSRAKRQRHRHVRCPLAIEQLEPRYALAGLSGSVVSVFEGQTYVLPGVTISVVGRNAQNAIIAQASKTTDASGNYSFAGLPAGTYTITETQPVRIAEGTAHEGSLGGVVTKNTISNINVGADDNGTGYNFRERGMAVISIDLFLSSTPDTATVFKNAVSNSTPASLVVSLNSVTSPITSANANSVQASGTGTPGATVSVVVTSGSQSSIARTDVVDDDGTWSVGSINVNQLANGTVTYTTTITNSDGATATSTRTATKSATDPLVDIVSATNPIGLTNQTSVSANGTAQLGSTVKVEVTDGTTTVTKNATLAADGTWSVTGIDASGLKDGSITYRVTMTDNAGQKFTDTFAAAKATVLITSATNPVGDASKANASASGTGQIGASISVVATDGTNTSEARTTTVNGSGNWTVSGINVSGLADGPITYIATATFGGASDTSQLSANKDTQAPALDLTSVTNPIRLNNYFSTTASGTGEANRTVSVVASDGTTTTTARTTTVLTGGTWSVSNIDLTGLKDGTITYTATITDAAGNTRTDTLTSTKTTVQIASVTDPVTAANVNNASASGTGQNGATVSVVVTAGGVTTTAKTAVVTGGTWSVSGLNLNRLANGTVTYRATITDSSGNSAVATFTATRNVADALVDIITATSPINLANQTSVSVNGKAQIGSAVKVEVTDGTTTTTAVNAVLAADGSWTVSGIDVSALKDGTITYRATMTDNENQTFTDTFTATKATVLITSATNPVGISTKTNASAQGTAQAGVAISVVATDGTNTTAASTTTSDGNGAWSVSGIDMSNLADGQITYIATANAGGGNTDESRFTASKDTLAPALDMTSVTNPIRLNNYFSTTASGTGEAGRTVSVVASDGTTSTAARTAVVQSDGSWSVTGINVGTLKDGTITFTATITDAAGNTTTDTLTSTKTTVVITSATDQITSANAENVTASGTGQPGATVSVVVTNGSATTAAFTAPISGAGTWTVTGIDVSDLPDGTLTFRATASDGSGNTSVASTLTRTKDATTSVAITSATNPIDANNQTSTSASGTTEIGATVSVTASDGTNTTAAKPAVVNANGSWTASGIDVSGLTNGTIVYTATATDTAGNTATATRNSNKSVPVGTLAVDDTYNLAIGATLTTTTANGVLFNDGAGASNPTLISGPAHGNITLNPDGTFTYTQTTYGFDKFVYEVTGPGNQTAQATVIIQVPGLPRLPEGAVLTTTASGLQFFDFEVGTGASPTASDTVTVDYVGYLPNGNSFDDGQNVDFPLSNLIVGFSEGVQGMKVGGTRRLIIPPNLGYGPGGNPGAGIGGTDTIVFDVTLDAIL